MKKLFAIVIMCALSANVVFAQNNSQKGMRMRHNFEHLDSTALNHMMQAHKDYWEKRKKEDEKRWRKHMAWGYGHRMNHWFMPNMPLLGQPQEEVAQFDGGEEALISWIEENITYPSLAYEGKVVVTFDVDVDGSIGNIKVKESANPILDSEVVDKLKTMPKWIPAKQNGRTVKMRYTLPINFTTIS